MKIIEFKTHISKFLKRKMLHVKSYFDKLKLHEQLDWLYERKKLDPKS